MMSLGGWMNKVLIGWGIETMREMSMSDRHKHRVPTVKIEEIFPDPRALDELKEIGVAELPDARSCCGIFIGF